MWVCPNCKTELEHVRMVQNCFGNPVLEYIQLQPLEIQEILYMVRNAILEVLPDALETMSWQMPTYRVKTNIIHFAANKNHLGIYPGSKAIEHFNVVLTSYKHSKGAIIFPFKQPIPLKLIQEITLWNYDTGNRT